MAYKVLATRILPPQAQQYLTSLDIDLDQWDQDCTMPRDELLKRCRGVHGILCLLTDKMDQAVLDAAGPECRVISTMSVGYDHIDVSSVQKAGIALGYTPNVLTDATADTTILLALCAARRIKECLRAVEGEWREWRPTWLCGTQFTGKTLGIVGLGRIGEAVVQRMRAFGIRRVVYASRSAKPERDQLLRVERVELDELLRVSDVVVCTAALTEETKDMFDLNAFKRMKPSAIFVNSSRGGLVQQDDLVTALSSSPPLIGAAGLDVTTPEPLPPTHPLLALDNCVIVPHIGSATYETREEMGRLAVENLSRGLQGQALVHSVYVMP